jgi:hypothetical protein
METPTNPAAGMFDDIPPVDTTAPTKPTSAAGMFDEFTQPPATSDKTAPFGAQAKREAGLLARMPIDALTALPLGIAEGGAGIGNYIRHGITAVAGDNPITGGEDYSPMRDYQSLMGRIFPTPTGFGEKASNIAGSVLSGAGAARLPGAAGELAGAALQPSLGVKTAPANFASLADQKRDALVKALTLAREQGYKIPPFLSNLNLKNWIIGSAGGKAAMPQEASAGNAPVTQQLAARYVGLNPDAEVTPAALAAVRREQSQSYQTIRGAGQLDVDKTFGNLVNRTRGKFTGMQESFPGTAASPIIDDLNSFHVGGDPAQPVIGSFDASHAIDKIDSLRDSATRYFRSGDKQLGGSYRQLADGLEEQIQRGLEAKAASGTPGVSPDAVANFRNSRQIIARTHTVEDALTPSNQVSMPAIVRALKGGEPISGSLAQAGRLAADYPKAFQEASQAAGHGVSALDMMWPAAAEIAGHVMGGEPGMGAAVGALWPATRYAARKYALADLPLGLGQGAAIPGNFGGRPHPALTAALVQALQGEQRGQ